METTHRKARSALGGETTVQRPVEDVPAPASDAAVAAAAIASLLTTILLSGYMVAVG